MIRISRGELKSILAERDDWRQRAEAAEAKLAELEKQEPYGYVHNVVNPPLGSGVAASIFKKENRHYGRPVFTRPAPAVDLAELVPDEMPRSVVESVEWRSEKKDGLECYHGENLKRAYGPIRAAILRNIEES